MAGSRNSRPLGPSSLWGDEDADDRSDDPQPLKARWDPVDTEAPSTRPQRERPARTQKRRSAFGWFVHHYGWRAYAIPVLIALTVVVIIQIVRDSTAAVASESLSTSAAGEPDQASGPAETGSVPATITTTLSPVTVTSSAPAPDPTTTPMAPVSSTMVGPEGSGEYVGTVAFGELPEGPELVAQGNGSWRVVPGTTEKIGEGDELFTYTVEVEEGLQDPALDAEFAAKVDATLADPRSWIASGQYAWQRIDSGEPDVRIALTSQMTTRETCGWSVPLESSCFYSVQDLVVINDARWERGAISYHGDLGSYRTYAINHEVGHALGYSHQPCGEDGGLAPVMMQQSWSVSNDELSEIAVDIPADGAVCLYNPYPYPRGTQSAPQGTEPTEPTS